MTSMPEWRWDPDDFAVLWYSDANDRIPDPFSYTSTLATNNEVAAHRTAVRARYDAEETEQIELALHTLSTCQLRIEIIGHSTALGNGTPREYRILGARTPQHSVMLTQTAADGIDSPIRCRLFRSEQLPTRVATVIPAAPAGNTKPEIFHTTDLSAQHGHGGHGRSPRERFERLTARLAGSGVAGLLTGPLYQRPNPWYTIGWFEVPGDGRYTQQQSREHITIRPAGAQDLTTTFTTWIDQSLNRFREDEPDTW
ncbi:ESX secretion-associated protein EspG [Nocardia miyunensis]|uniref:ESX secretion-associated protein EspG n=1 Tax=Nocardia miyunensis TaxID=282684 RepID=UPI0009FD8206|nr:ESX secretion-associated protein EspG [Nocardia miyunensis]